MDLTLIYLLPIIASSMVHGWISKPFCPDKQVLGNAKSPFTCESGARQQFGPPFYWGMVVFCLSLVAVLSMTLFMDIPWFSSGLVSLLWCVLGSIAMVIR
jgi:hypothetical protein